jgi:PmbA protein
MAMSVAGDRANTSQSPKTGFSFKIAKGRDELDIDYLVDDAHKRAISMLGAKSVKSGKYKMVMENRTVNDFMMTFSSIFSAENVQKGKSLLKGKLGKRIANDKLTIYDDPHIQQSISSQSFDAEGVATYKKELVSKGILKTYLHNLKTAYKDGVKTTGNATKTSYKSPITVSPSNLVIGKGDMTQEELIKECGDGIFINSLAGLHSGANPISGDFSLMASGFRIENGKITHPIEQITVSSNLFDLFNQIQALGNDLEQSPPAGSTFFSPSILFKEINVAGSE